MPGTPPLGPATILRAPVQPLGHRAPAVLCVLVALAAALAATAGPARAQAPAPCANAAAVLGAVAPEAVESAVSCLVNGIRAESRLPALQRSTVLESVARRHGNDMVAR